MNPPFDGLTVVRGGDWVKAPRMSGRTTNMIQDALHQIDFLEKGDEVWIVFTRWETAKRMCEWVGNSLAKELGFERNPPDYNSPMVKEERVVEQRWSGVPNRVRYYLMIEGIPYHFVSIESLELQLLGIRFRTGPCVYFDHTCYEFHTTQMNDLYPLLRDVSCSLPA